MKRGAKVILAVLAIGFVRLALCAPPTVEAKKTVVLNPGPYMNPSTLVVQKGEEVIWQNRTGFLARIYFRGEEGAPRMLDDVTSSATGRFDKVGRYAYSVEIGDGTSVVETLWGEVIVEEAGVPARVPDAPAPKPETKRPSAPPSPPAPRPRGPEQWDSSRVGYNVLKRGVVKIIAHKSGKVKDTGAGIVASLEKNIVLVLTAHHVVEGAQTIEVVFFDKQYEKFQGRRFEKYDEDLDIAVITVEPVKGRHIPTDLPGFTLGDISKLREGEKVSTLGHPLDLEWHLSVNANTIAGLNDRGDFRKFRFTKSAIERGNSGGPVFDGRGALIGMVTKVDALHAIAVKMDAALLVLKEAWRIPTTHVKRP